MKVVRRTVLASLSGVVVLGLLLAACAPAAPMPTPAPVAPPKPAVAPTSTVAPAQASVSPQPTEAADKPKHGGILRTSARADIANYDMHQESTMFIQNPLAPLYSLLVQNDPLDETKIIPDLAEKWEVSPDGKVWTFYLHRGVKWHDGKPATSADVRATFERIIWPPKGVASVQKDTLASVDKIETPDDYTVRFTLKFPQGGFLQMVGSTHNFIFPKHILDAKGDMRKDINGTGPFRLKRYDRGVAFEVERNPDYFIEGRPYLDGILRYILLDEAAITAAFRSHRLHMLPGGASHSTPPKLRALLQKENTQIRVKVYLTSTNNAFMPNVRRKPWSDVRVRKAAMMVIDHQLLVQSILDGDGYPYGFMPPGPWALPEEEMLKMPIWAPVTDAKTAEAKRLLAEAGYPGGFNTSIVTRADSRWQRDASIAENDMLRKIGIDLKVEQLLSGEYYQRENSRSFEITNGGTSGSSGEPEMNLQAFLTGHSRNAMGWSNPKYDELFYKQMGIMDPAERKKVVLEMQRLLAEEAPAVPNFWIAFSVLWWPEVHDFDPGHSLYLGMKMQDVWLSK